MHPQDWNLPYGLTILTLFCIVMVRSNGTYWIGRGVVAGTSHTRWRRVLETSPYRVGSSWLHRWGPPAVTLSFLVIGLQTWQQAWPGCQCAATCQPLSPAVPSGHSSGARAE